MKKFLRVLLAVALVLGAVGLLSGQQIGQIIGIILVIISIGFVIKFPQILSPIELGYYIIGREAVKNYRGSDRQGIVISFDFFAGTVCVANVYRRDSIYTLYITGATIRSDDELRDMGALELANKTRSKNELPLGAL